MKYASFLALLAIPGLLAVARAGDDNGVQLTQPLPSHLGPSGLDGYELILGVRKNSDLARGKVELPRAPGMRVFTHASGLLVSWQKNGRPLAATDAEKAASSNLLEGLSASQRETLDKLVQESRAVLLADQEIRDNPDLAEDQALRPLRPLSLLDCMTIGVAQFTSQKRSDQQRNEAQKRREGQPTPQNATPVAQTLGQTLEQGPRTAGDKDLLLRAVAEAAGMRTRVAYGLILDTERLLFWNWVEILVEGQWVAASAVDNNGYNAEELPARAKITLGRTEAEALALLRQLTGHAVTTRMSRETILGSLQELPIASACANEEVTSRIQSFAADAAYGREILVTLGIDEATATTKAGKAMNILGEDTKNAAEIAANLNRIDPIDSPLDATRVRSLVIDSIASRQVLRLENIAMRQGRELPEATVRGLLATARRNLDRLLGPISEQAANDWIDAINDRIQSELDAVTATSEQKK